MKIKTLTVAQWSSPPSGEFFLVSDDANLTVKMTEEEVQEILALALKFFFARQKKISESVASMTPPMLAPPTPEVEDAEFTPVDPDDFI